MTRKKPIERADLDALLQHLMHLGDTPPSSVATSERPDFIIMIGNKAVGVETTRSVYQEYVRAEKLHETECPSSWISLTNLKDRTRRRSNEEILADMLRLFGPWEDVGAAMLGWKQKIAASLRSKRLKLNEPGYQLLAESWLLIHDEPPFPPKDASIVYLAGRHLSDLFFKQPGVKRDFDLVFVHSGRYLWRWCRTKLQFHYDRHEG